MTAHFSPAVAREAARELLAELPSTEDRRVSMDDFWIGRLRTALADLLGAEPMTLGDCSDMIRQALKVRARLLGETSEPVPPVADRAHTHVHQGQALRHAHAGGEQQHGYFEHPEDLDAGELVAEDAR